MLPLFGDDGNRLPHTYNGYTLNDPNADPTESVLLDSVVPATALRTVSEELPTGDGAEAYEVRKVGRLYRLEGRIRAQTFAKLYDMSEQLSAAFDPAKISHEHASDPFLPYDFSVPTTNLTAYPSGLIPCRYYARSRICIEPPETRYMGKARPFRIELFMEDPRRYLQSLSGLTGSGVADNTRADYRSWPEIGITAAGPGAANYTITNSTTGKSLVLNLSGLAANDAVVVDMQARSILKNGVETGSLYVSGEWWEMEPGNNTITITNGTNMTTVTAWRSAFCD